MEIKMLMPIFDKWDCRDRKYGVLLVELLRHEGEIIWFLNKWKVGRFTESFSGSIDYLEKTYPEYTKIPVLKKVHVRLENNDRLPYYLDDLTNTTDLETFKEHLKNGLYNIS